VGVGATAWWAARPGPARCSFQPPGTRRDLRHPARDLVRYDHTVVSPNTPPPSSVPLPGLAQDPIHFAGGWLPEREPGVWEGSVTGDGPVCGIAFLVHGAGVSWAKSERASGECRVSLHLGWHDRDSGNISVSFSVGGGGARWSTTFETRPVIPEERYLITESLLHLFDVPGSELLSCYAAFLRGDQTKVGRNGLWHLRPRYAEALHEPLRKTFTYGRSGELETEEVFKAVPPL